MSDKNEKSEVLVSVLIGLALIGIGILTIWRLHNGQ